MLQHPRSLSCTCIFWKSSILVSFPQALQFVIAFLRGSPRAWSPKCQLWGAKFLQHWLMSTSHRKEVLTNCSSLGSWWKEQVPSISPGDGKGGRVTLQQWKKLEEEYDHSVWSPQISFFFGHSLDGVPLILYAKDADNLPLCKNDDSWETATGELGETAYIMCTSQMAGRKEKKQQPKPKWSL